MHCDQTKLNCKNFYIKVKIKGFVCGIINKLSNVV